jgi:hypothetical protein
MLSKQINLFLINVSSKTLMFVMLIAFFIYNNVNAQSFSIVENISGYSAGDDVEFWY